MGSKHKTIIWVGFTLAAIVGLYPPWVSSYHPLQFGSIFLPPSGASSVDIQRVAIIWAVIAGLTYAVVKTVQEDKSKKSIGKLPVLCISIVITCAGLGFFVDSEKIRQDAIEKERLAKIKEKEEFDLIWSQVEAEAKQKKELEEKEREKKKKEAERQATIEAWKKPINRGTKEIRKRLKGNLITQWSDAGYKSSAYKLTLKGDPAVLNLVVTNMNCVVCNLQLLNSNGIKVDDIPILFNSAKVIRNASDEILRLEVQDNFDIDLNKYCTIKKWDLVGLNK